MRFVPIYCIRESTVLAKPIINANGDILLREGIPLKRAYLKKLLNLGVSGAYVEDELSEGLEITNILSDKLRVQVVGGIKNAFMDAANNKQDTKAAQNTMEQLNSMAENIVDEILTSDSILVNLADIKIYDDYTFFHCLQVATLSVVLGLGFQFNRNRLVKLAMAGLTHDIGKVFIPEEIINKNGPLTGEEYGEVKKHPQNGYDYLRDHYKMPEVSARGVLQHHERYDGTGYPESKTGKEISQFGRIIAAADVYDALVSDRPYRKGIFAADAMEFILGGSGIMFDPEVVAMMNHKMALFPLGTCVLLSNGAMGLVIENYEGFGQRPKLKIFREETRAVEPYIMDLHSDYSVLNITIVATTEV